MNSSRGRNIARVTISLGALVLITAAIAGRSPILERWYLYKLEEGSAEEERQAAQRLGELKSIRAIPALILHLEKELLAWSEAKKYLQIQKDSGISINDSPQFNSEFLDALALVGEKATVRLNSAQFSWPLDQRSLLIGVITERENLKVAFLPLLIDALQDADSMIRRAALFGLEKFDTDEVVARETGKALEKIGKPAQFAIERLRQLSEGDEDFLVRSTMVAAVEQIGRAPE